jgi:hypothetical protein
MHFFLPEQVIDDKKDDDNITLIYKQRKLPVAVLGVDLVMDFIVEGKNEEGKDVIIVVRGAKTEPFVTVLN